MFALEDTYLSVSRSWAVKVSSGVEPLGMCWGAAAAKGDRARRPARRLIMALVGMFDVVEVAMMRRVTWIRMIMCFEDVMSYSDAGSKDVQLKASSTPFILQRV